MLYRVVVTNNSENSLMLTGAQVTDTGGPSPFMFGGSETFSLAAGATITSDVSSTLAAAGYHLDTATLTGTITDSRNNSSISGSDTADYTGETYSATLQKQIDVNGHRLNRRLRHWADRAGRRHHRRARHRHQHRLGRHQRCRGVRQRHGPRRLHLRRGSRTTVIAVGGSVTSDVATVIASTGYQADTATLNGSVSDSYGDTGAVSATSGANFTGTTPSITIDKQISVNGACVDRYRQRHDRSLVLAGATSPSKSSPVNTGSLGISDASVSDVGAGPPAPSTFGGNATFALAAGQTVTSNIATVIAGTGYQSDTATVTGTASDAYGDTQSVSAHDSANFTGETPSITIVQTDLRQRRCVDRYRHR